MATITFETLLAHLKTMPKEEYDALNAQYLAHVAATEDNIDEEDEDDDYNELADPRECPCCKEEFTPSMEHDDDLYCDECVSETCAGVLQQASRKTAGAVNVVKIELMKRRIELTRQLVMDFDKKHPKMLFAPPELHSLRRKLVEDWENALEFYTDAITQ